MRLRIVKRMRGEIDGISLDQFQAGEVYDVGTRIGSYLLAMRAAVPVGEPGSKPAVDSRSNRAKAADGGRVRHRPRRKAPK